MELQTYFSQKFQSGLTVLLQEKHLYQGVNLAEGGDEWCARAHGASEEARIVPSIGKGYVGSEVPLSAFEEIFAKYIRTVEFYLFVSETGRALDFRLDRPSAYLPPVDAYCPGCDFGPRTFSASAVVSHPDRAQAANSKCGQSWILTYCCAKCRSILEYYIVRDGASLKLCGRFPIEIVPVADEIPRQIRGFLSKALIAADTGNVLAGIFFLRVALEQFFHSLADVMKLCPNPRPSGDELGAAYNSTLPVSLKNVPSLKDLYSKLSDSIHGAKEDRELFDSCCKDIVRHFKARDVFRDDIAAMAQGR